MTIDLYHGSNQIIEHPTLTGGNIHNDYGQGFYCTRHIELAKEWAVSEHADGFINHYSLDTDGLNILNLNTSEYSILHWLTLLLSHRIINLSSAISKQGYEYLLRHYSLDTSAYDVILGYRADDSYFSFARSFLSNTITIEQLEESMYLGELGEQYFLQSQKAFSKLTFIDWEPVDKAIYYPQKEARNLKARRSYQKTQTSISTGSFLIDIIRKEK